MQSEAQQWLSAFSVVLSARAAFTALRAHAVAIVALSSRSISTGAALQEYSGSGGAYYRAVRPRGVRVIRYFHERAADFERVARTDDRRLTVDECAPGVPIGKCVFCARWWWGGGVTATQDANTLLAFRVSPSVLWVWRWVTVLCAFALAQDKVFVADAPTPCPAARQVFDRVREAW